MWYKSIQKLEQIKQQREGLSNNFFDVFLKKWPGIFRDCWKDKVYLKGNIIHKNRDMVFVDTGLKSDASIPLNTNMVFFQKNKTEPGNSILLHVDYYDFNNGEILVKNQPKLKKKNQKEFLYSYWDRVAELKRKKIIIPGWFEHDVRGGFIINLLDHIAFLPGSHYRKFLKPFLKNCKTRVARKKILLNIKTKLIFFQLINFTPLRDNLVVTLFNKTSLFTKRKGKFLNAKRTRKSVSYTLKKRKKKKHL